jgi:glycosyltransferase involved in cell wall biosynthesis
VTDPPLVSVVVPLYNESRVLPELCQRLHMTLAPLGDYEVILVDDGSVDDTWARIEAEHALRPQVKAIRLARNFGHQVALSAALDVAQGAVTVMMDGDLQDPPELIPDMIARWREGFDVVYAVKRRRKESWPKRAAFRGFHALLHRVADIEVPEGAGNFSLMSRRVVDVLCAMPERVRYLSGLRAWIGFRQGGVTFDRDTRYDDAPRMGLGRLMRLAGDAIFGFSRLPLRLALYAGIIVSVVSLGVGVWVLYQRLFTTNAITGWASPLVSILFIGGTILITLAVIGEYVGRIYDEVKQRPLYVVRGVLGLESGTASNADRLRTTIMVADRR